MSVQDLARVVDMHLASLPESFFSRLGHRFLREYYRGFVLSPWAVALVLRSDGIEGFVVGAHPVHGHASWTLRRRGWRLAVLGAWSLLLRPSLLKVFVTTRLGRYVRGVSRRLSRQTEHQAGATHRGGRAAVLSHLAVEPDRRGSGSGSVLVRSYCGAVRAAGATSVELVTLAGSAGAGDFYARLGFTGTGQRRDQEGTEWRYYRMSLAPPS